MSNKRNWVPIKCAGLFVSSIHGKDEKTGFTIIHDSIQGWGFISKSGKTISWHSGWRPKFAKRSKRQQKADSKKFAAVIFPVVRKTFSPSVNISEILKAQPMMA